MKFAIAVAYGVCAVFSGMNVANADWSLAAGAEHFRWKESTAPSVTESGARFVLDARWTQNKQSGFAGGYDLKLYAGRVDYNGAALGSGTPITGNTDYTGITNEAQLNYRMPSRPFAVFAALGWDHWNRKLSAAQQETYDVIYGRLGLRFDSMMQAGALGSVGLKYPLWIREDAHLTDIGFNQNPLLRPGKQVSVYATAGYRLSRTWSVIAHYDSYRFGQSGDVFATSRGRPFIVFQPKTAMDVIGAKLQYNF